MYEYGMSCTTCQNCKTREITDDDGCIIREECYCVIDGCEVYDNMSCGNYQ